MPAFAADRPPLDTYALVCSIAKDAFKPGGFDRGKTGRASRRGTIRTPKSRRVTNNAPDLSIARVNAASIISAATEDLERYSRFSRGWDGYDGEPIAPAAIRVAQAIVEALRSGRAMNTLTDVIPGPASDGSLDLELRAAERHLTITIYPASDPELVELRTFRSTGTEVKERHVVEQEALVADLRWLLS